MRKINIIIIQLLALTVLVKSGFCAGEKDIGIILEPGKYDNKRIFYSNGDEKREIKLKGELFIEPVFFKRSSDGRYILFIGSDVENSFDGYVYLYDTENKETKRLLMRNITVKYVRKLEWFDSHSFMIKILSDHTLNFVIGKFGPFKSGSYVIKFDENFEVDNMKKIVW